MPAELCAITGTVYNGAGAAVEGLRLYIKKVVKDGVLVRDGSDNSISATSGENGAISFSVHRDSTIYVQGSILGFTTGAWLTVPDAETANLEDLLPAVSPPSTAVNQATFNTHIQKLANPDDAGHITNVGAGLSLADGIISLGDLDATFATDAALTAEAAARAAADALLQPTSEKNQANGYVGLDGSGLIADIRIPASIARDSEVTSAIAALSTVYQPLDTDLTTIAGLSPSASDVLQFVGGAWANRTPAQLKTSLSLAQADISGLTTASSPSFAGLTLTGPILLPDGTVTAPALTFAGETGRGFYHQPGNIIYAANNVTQAAFAPNTFRMRSDFLLAWTNGEAYGGTGDVALQRHAAGVARVSNSSTGAGQLLIGPSSTTIGAQLHVVSSAAGTKGLIVQMAAAPTANPLEIQDSTGAAVAALTLKGQIQAQAGQFSSGFGYTFNGSSTQVGLYTPSAGSASMFAVGGGSAVLEFRSGGVNVGSGVYGFGGLGVAPTASLSGGSSVVSVGDGGANANGTLKAARFQFSTTVTPSGSADAQGTVGDMRYDDSFVYVKTSGGWKRAALATF